MADNVDQVLDNVYQLVNAQLKDFLNGTPQINSSNVDEIIKVVMECIDVFSSGQVAVLSSTRKAELGKQLLKRVFADLAKSGKLSAESLQFWNTIVDHVGPAIFKLVVMADKGYIHINQEIQEAMKDGCGCFGKKETATKSKKTQKHN